jgi:dCTP diphosphatase
MVVQDRLDRLESRIRAFAAARDWGRFHTPKNLAMALAGEVGELVAEFQWLTPEESTALLPEARSRVREEMADVLIYLLRLSDVLEVDLGAAVEDKIALNEAKYPADRARGSAAKYTEWQ